MCHARRTMATFDMTLLFWVLWVFYLLIALRWFYGWYEINRNSMDHLRLRGMPERAAMPEDPTLTVLIAAHNEAAGIEHCLNQLRGQNFAISQIVIANDRSTDATGEIIDRLASEDRRIAHVRVSELPAGWIGKTHALCQGAKHATGDYILFIDSDVFLHDGALAAVMDAVISRKADFMTLWPRLGLRSPADQILVPPTGWMLSFWSWAGAGTQTDAKAIQDPVMGNGQFLLIRREAYERIGGHEAVRDELAEDAMIAHNAAAAGLKRWVGLGTGIYVASRHSTFSRCANGMARVIIGSLVKPWKVLLSTQLMLGCILPFWCGPLAAWLYLSGYDPTLTLLFVVVAVAHVIGMFMTLRRLFHYTMEQRGSLWLFPLGAVGVLGILFWSLLVMTGKSPLRWGATRYRVNGSKIVGAALK